MRYNTVISIAGKEVSFFSPVYFIADIASNHDGDLNRAKELIHLAAVSGADAVKFQHFTAERIVSDIGFRHLGKTLGHQANWDKSVFEIYRECECKHEWSIELFKTARECNVHFMTTPYDMVAVDLLDDLVPAYKIGSGDITWIDFLIYVAQRQKPVILATGASTLSEVTNAVDNILKYNPQCVLLQCNTNYTGSVENFKSVNLKVLRLFDLIYPNLPLGLSDHTPGYTAVLGAVTLGARVIEKHFTDDNERRGPDHAFSMNPSSWKEMVLRCRELENALGDGIKKVEDNEKETVVLQRRCLRLKCNKSAGEVLNISDIDILRPAPRDALEPNCLHKILNQRLKNSKCAGEALYQRDLEN